MRPGLAILTFKMRQHARTARAAARSLPPGMQGMKVVILCGGRGTRLGRETDTKPKPMAEIGDKPILWHIMKHYASYGFKDFILCLGYRGEVIRRYFLDYLTANCDFTISLADTRLEFHNRDRNLDWNVTLVDTGLDAMTGARVKRIERYIDSERFMLTYGDGVSDLNLHELLKFHEEHGAIGTVTGVQPRSRFGELKVHGNRITEFHEKVQFRTSYVNGGFFVFSRKFFDYLEDDDSCVLEKKPLEQLARDEQMMIYKHCGFWQCVDTIRDLELLNDLWTRNAAPWKVWQ